MKHKCFVILIMILLLTELQLNLYKNETSETSQENGLFNIISERSIDIEMIEPSLSRSSEWTQTTFTDFSNGTLENLTIFGIGDDAELRLDFLKFNQWINKNPK